MFNLFKKRSAPEPLKVEVGSIKATFHEEDGEPLFKRTFDGWWTGDDEFQFVTSAEERFHKWLAYQKETGFIEHSGTLYPTASIARITVERLPLQRAAEREDD